MAYKYWFLNMYFFLIFLMFPLKVKDRMAEVFRTIAKLKNSRDPSWAASQPPCGTTLLCYDPETSLRTTHVQLNLRCCARNTEAENQRRRAARAT
jgi:hypothetical protein